MAVPAEKERPIQSSTPPGGSEQAKPSPQGRPNAIPARMLGDEAQVPVPSMELQAENGWLTSDGKKLTAVYAGRAPKEGTARIVVVRQPLERGRQTEDVVDVDGVKGSVRISSAPTGAAAETEAQEGELARTEGRGRTARNPRSRRRFRQHRWMRARSARERICTPCRGPRTEVDPGAA